MSSDGYAAIIVDRSPRIVRMLTAWGAPTAVTITGEQGSGYAVAVAGTAAGTRRTLREAVNLAARLHSDGAASDTATGPQIASKADPDASGGIRGAAARMLSNDASAGALAGIAQAGLGIGLVLAFASGCLPIPGV